MFGLVWFFVVVFRGFLCVFIFSVLDCAHFPGEFIYRIQ